MATRASFLREEFGASFEEKWPELARRLERFLGAKGVETWLRADVVQETATRLYRKWSTLDQSRPLWNLVVTIALGVLVDERRKLSRLELVGNVPGSEADDVEARALDRVHLVRTRSAMKHLRADQRRVLLAEIGEAAALEGSRNRINVLRLRARLALKSELGPWAPASVALRVRSLKTAIERRALEWGRDAHGLAASVATVAAAATLLLPGVGPEAGVGGTSGGSWSQQSIVQGEQVWSLDEVRALSLRIPADVSREPRELGSRAKQRAQQEAPSAIKPATDQLHQALDKYHEGMREAHSARDQTRRAAFDKKKEALRKKDETVRDVRDLVP